MLTISFSQQKFRTPLLVSHQGEKLPMTMTFDVIKIRDYLIGKQSNESSMFNKDIPFVVGQAVKTRLNGVTYMNLNVLHFHKSD